MARLKQFAEAICIALLGQIIASAAQADDAVADFYRGKTLTIVVGYAPGGGYDQAARLLAKHFGKYIPGQPQIVVQNMPGAASVAAANYLYGGAPRDGSTIGLLADFIPLAKLLNTQGVRFDSQKMAWIGSMASRGTPTIYVRSDSPATTLEAARDKVDLLGAAGLDATSAYAVLANDLLDTKFKVIYGYSGGGAEINLAVTRGEVNGRAGWDWETLKHDHPDWIANKTVTVLVQLALKSHPDLADTPLAIDLAKNDDDRQIMELIFGSGRFLRTFSAPEDVPQARLDALRDAFEKAVNDPDFIADADNILTTGRDFARPSDIEAFFKKVYAFPKRVTDRAAKYVAP